MDRLRLEPRDLRGRRRAGRHRGDLHRLQPQGRRGPKAERGLHAYGSIATGTQTPTSDELSLNPDLGLTRVRNYEVGLKVRRPYLTLDTAVYYGPVRDEVVQVLGPHGETEYVNAGATREEGPGAGAQLDAVRRHLAGGQLLLLRLHVQGVLRACVRTQPRPQRQRPALHPQALLLGPRRLRASLRCVSASRGQHLGQVLDGQREQRDAPGIPFCDGPVARLRGAALRAGADRPEPVRPTVRGRGPEGLYGGLRYSPAAPRCLLARFAFKL